MPVNKDTFIDAISFLENEIKGYKDAKGAGSSLSSAISGVRYLYGGRSRASKMQFIEDVEKNLINLKVLLETPDYNPDYVLNTIAAQVTALENLESSNEFKASQELPEGKLRVNPSVAAVMIDAKKHLYEDLETTFNATASRRAFLYNGGMSTVLKYSSDQILPRSILDFIDSRDHKKNPRLRQEIAYKFDEIKDAKTTALVNYDSGSLVEGDLTRLQTAYDGLYEAMNNLQTDGKRAHDANKERLHEKFVEFFKELEVEKRNCTKLIETALQYQNVPTSSVSKNANKM